MVQSIEKGPGFGHVQKKKKSLIISKLTVSFFFFLLYFNLCYLMKDFGLFFFFCACIREREGLLQVYLPYLQGYYIIHGMIIVLF